MAYKLTISGVQRLADGAFIPADERNADWREYQVWLAKGNTPEPADAPPPAPQPRDLAAEIDDLKSRLERAERKV